MNFGSRNRYLGEKTPFGKCKDLANSGVTPGATRTRHRRSGVVTIVVTEGGGFGASAGAIVRADRLGSFRASLGWILSGDRGRPALPSRLIAWLSYLQHATARSHEELVLRWLEPAY